MKRYWTLIFVFGILFISAVRNQAQAQIVVGVKAGVVEFAVGSVFLDSKPLSVQKNGNVLMRKGQRLSTEKGFAEVVLTPDAIFRMSENSALRVIGNELKEVRLEFEKGIAIIEILREIEGRPITVNISSGVMEFKAAGRYRISGDSSTLSTYYGSATSMIGGKKIKIKTGKMIHFDHDLNAVNSDAKEVDVFFLWTLARSFRLYALQSIARSKSPMTGAEMMMLHNPSSAANTYNSTGQSSSPISTPSSGQTTTPSSGQTTSTPTSPPHPTASPGGYK